MRAGDLQEHGKKIAVIENEVRPLLPRSAPTQRPDPRFGGVPARVSLLLRVMLSSPHHPALCVAQFGEIGIDDALVKQKFDTEEEIFEMNNGW